MVFKMNFFRKTTFKFLLLIVCLVTIICLYIFFKNLVQAGQLINSPIEMHPFAMPLLDLPQFRYIINNNPCSVEVSNFSIKAILIVTSYAGNVKERNMIRQAYPISELKKLGIHRVFLLAALKRGADVKEKTTISQSDLLIENKSFSDLIQGNFDEAYRNLTYKHVMGLQWAVSYCKEAHYLIKMDDDIAVDLYQLLGLLKSQVNLTQEKLLMGYILHGLLPVRDTRSKWFVTRKEYSMPLYPPFLSGWLYVTTLKTAQILVNTSKSVRFFWIDDTYVTGMLAIAAGIKHIDIGETFAVHPEYLACCLQGVYNAKLACDFMVGPLGSNYKLLHAFQQHAAYCDIHKCPKRLPHRTLKKTCVTQEVINLGRGNANIMPYNLF